jgi:hypothetical protein
MLLPLRTSTLILCVVSFQVQTHLLQERGQNLGDLGDGTWVSSNSPACLFVSMLAFLLLESTKVGL